MRSILPPARSHGCGPRPSRRFRGRRAVADAESPSLPKRASNAATATCTAFACFDRVVAGGDAARSRRRRGSASWAVVAGPLRVRVCVPPPHLCCWLSHCTYVPFQPRRWSPPALRKYGPPGVNAATWPTAYCLERAAAAAARPCPDNNGRSSIVGALRVA